MEQQPVEQRPVEQRPPRRPPRAADRRAGRRDQDRGHARRLLCLPTQHDRQMRLGVHEEPRREVARALHIDHVGAPLRRLGLPHIGKRERVARIRRREQAEHQPGEVLLDVAELHARALPGAAPASAAADRRDVPVVAGGPESARSGPR